MKALSARRRRLGRPKLKKILLVSMPWADPEVPSIQIATLKNYLKKQGVDAEAAHWHLEVALALGFDGYFRISSPESSSGEPLYSYLAFPEMRAFLLENDAVIRRAKRIQKELEKLNDKSPLRFRWTRDFFREFEALHLRILDRYDWKRYALVGFTLNYGQTVASLYMAREIKKRNPDCRIILGGAEASGELGASLVENFEEIDYACNGEGETPLFNLSKAILRGDSEEDLARIDGIVSRGRSGKAVVNPPRQLESLDEIGTPDYDEYFACFERHGIVPQSMIRELPIEASRGCPFACNFCGLNLQWENFRSRSPEAVSAEIKALSERYRFNGFRFMDNILPRNSAEMFERIASQGRDYQFFYEIRAQTPPKVLKRMKEAGAVRIQCGIEALTTSILEKFNKKAKFIHNLQAMKFCEELEIVSGSNIILNYPLSSPEDVKETLKNMEYCLAYGPPTLSFYRLNVGAPDYENAARIGLGRIRNDDIYRYIYPPRLFKNLHLMGKASRALGRRADWNPVRKAVTRWKKLYFAGKKRLADDRRTLLEYYDGGSFLHIEDRRGLADGSCTLYVLDEFQREVYLYADEIRAWNAFHDRFQGQEEELRNILGYFLDRKLMYEEDGHYLSLAMNVRPFGSACEADEVRHYAENSGLAAAG